MRTEIYKRNIK